ncbi:MAG: serine/threonine-protein kinase, partial [Myxococcota bacterium]
MTQRFGNFEIIRKIAAGGMAEVYLAKHTGLGGFERLVCIKKILPHLGEQEEFIKMFQDEARIAANVIHPNIAQIYDIGEADESYYIAMEYVRGEDVRRVYNQEVSRGRAMPGEQAAQIVMYAAAGLDFAHRQSSIDGRPLGIVHRDISPQNVLVSYDGHVKIVDFGVAKAQGKLAETRAGVLKGKYSYMSPEQASGDPIDGRTDVFALGITLYEITTGTRLFKRESEIETLHAVIDCEVRPPRDVNPGYDPQLEQIVLKALRKNPDDRYGTAGDMERALERFLIDRGYPTGASSLADYMHDLFAEKLADDMMFGASVSHSQPKSNPDTDRPVTRALTPSAQVSFSSSGWGSGASESGPVTVEDEHTIAEEDDVPAPRPTESTSAAGSGSWNSHSGWSSVRSGLQDQTRTHAAPHLASAPSVAERPVMMQHQVTEPSNSYSDIV